MDEFLLYKVRLAELHSAAAINGRVRQIERDHDGVKGMVGDLWQPALRGDGPAGRSDGGGIDPGSIMGGIIGGINGGTIGGINGGVDGAIFGAILGAILGAIIGGIDGGFIGGDIGGDMGGDGGSDGGDFGGGDW